MAWIESHQKLKDDPKMVALAAAMNWSIHECIGRLHCFWWWCVDHCEDGDLRRYNDGVLAVVVALNPAEGKRFVDSMVAGCGNGEGFLERTPYFRIKNWWKFSGRFLQARYKQNPEKWREIKEKCCQAGVSVGSAERLNGSMNGSKNRQHNLTKHNITKQKHSPPIVPPLGAARGIKNSGSKAQIGEIVEFLNLKSGRNFRAYDAKGVITANGRVIKARLESLSPDAAVAKCKAIIAVKTREWRGKTWTDKETGDVRRGDNYLNPATLFGAKNFERYLGQLPVED